MKDQGIKSHPSKVVEKPRKLRSNLTLKVIGGVHGGGGGQKELVPQATEVNLEAEITHMDMFSSSCL